MKDDLQNERGTGTISGGTEDKAAGETRTYPQNKRKDIQVDDDS